MIAVRRSGNWARLFILSFDTMNFKEEHIKLTSNFAGSA
jgi:hypothetical protein